MAEGLPVLDEWFYVSNSNGMSMTLSAFGARLIELMVPDRSGDLGNVILGFDDLDAYRNNTGLYFGATVGRVAGRISGGKFSLEGQQYELSTNEGANHLHGGSTRSFDRVVWSGQNTTTERGRAVVFEYDSPHMEEGYPGRLSVRAEYALSDDDELWTVLTATTDALTPVNLTNHAYWSLRGGKPGSIVQHELMIAADHVVATDEDLVPSGGVNPVTNTARDFRRPRIIGDRLPEDSREPWPGFDNAYVLVDHLESDVVATLWDPQSGRAMEIRTSEPSLQVYTANRLPELTGRRGQRYGPGSAICLEPQRMPDAVNRSEFAPITLAPGDEYRHVSRYRFSVR